MREKHLLKSIRSDILHGLYILFMTVGIVGCGLTGSASEDLLQDQIQESVTRMPLSPIENPSVPIPKDISTNLDDVQDKIYTPVFIGVVADSVQKSTIASNAEPSALAAHALSSTNTSTVKPIDMLTPADDSIENRPNKEQEEQLADLLLKPLISPLQLPTTIITGQIATEPSLTELPLTDSQYTDLLQTEQQPVEKEAPEQPDIVPNGQLTNTLATEIAKSNTDNQGIERPDEERPNEERPNEDDNQALLEMGQGEEGLPTASEVEPDDTEPDRAGDDSDQSALAEVDFIEPEEIRVERTVNVPILMYHYLSIPPADADIYRLDLSVTPEQFSLHLDAMLDAGYTTISLMDLWNHLESGAELPEKPVVLTFDDGYIDNYENAFPILLQRGMTATFFIVTEFIEQQSPRYVTWDMVQEMFDAGMSIESHGIDHHSLKDRDDEFLIFQALRSKETIEARIGATTRFISYPAGQYDNATIDIFASANYLMGVTTIQGYTHSNNNYFELQRVRIRGTTDTTELLRLLRLDW